MNKTNFVLIVLSFSCAYSHAEDSMDGNNRTKTVMQSYIVATPCSIGTDSLYQNINIDYIANTKTESSNINKRKPFNVKLNNCISEFDKKKHKGIKIKLQANSGTNSNITSLSPPTEGVILYLYDINNNLLAQNKSYPISDNAIYFDQKNKINLLKYEAEIEAINNNIIPDNYFTTIKFDISYD